jgi:hypothetical protein
MPFVLSEAREILARTPGVMRALLAGLSDAWIHANTEPDGWSPFDVVGHLIHGEETDWIPRLRIILESGEARAFEPFDRFAQFDKSKGKALPELLDRFAQLRAKNLECLDGLRLTEAQLRLRGKHPALGPVTAEQLLATWVTHDLTHIVQTSRVMAKRYTETVGPWKEYLGVLNRE